MRHSALLTALFLLAGLASKAGATTVLIQPVVDDTVSDAFPEALKAISRGQPGLDQAFAAHLEAVSAMEPAAGRAWLADTAARAPKGTPRNAAFWLSTALSSPGYALGMRRYLGTLADGPRLVGLFERLAPDTFEKEEASVPEPPRGSVASFEGARQAGETLARAASLDAKGTLWEHATEPLSIDVESKAARPGYHFGHSTRLEKGPWSAGVEGQFSFFGRAPDQRGGGGEHSVELEVKRQAGRKGFVFGEAEWARDSFVGLRDKVETRLGYGRELVDSRKHELEFEASLGPVRERTYAGETERFLSPALGVEYAFKPSPAWRISERLTADFNKLKGVEEVISLTEVAYRISRKLSLRAGHHFRLQGETVPGFPNKTSGTTFGLVFNH